MVFLFFFLILCRSDHIVYGAQTQVEVNKHERHARRLARPALLVRLAKSVVRVRAQGHGASFSAAKRLGLLYVSKKEKKTLYTSGRVRNGLSYQAKGGPILPSRRRVFGATRLVPPRPAVGRVDTQSLYSIAFTHSTTCGQFSSKTGSYFFTMSFCLTQHNAVGTDMDTIVVATPYQHVNHRSLCWVRHLRRT